MTQDKLFFFIFSFTCYLITYFIGYYVGIETIRGKIMIFLTSIIFTLALYGYIQIAQLFKEGFLMDLGGPKSCQGGNTYMWQGDAPEAQYCRKLASTPEGMAQINSLSCGKGLVGRPRIGFEDTPMSNDCWQNEMCS